MFLLSVRAGLRAGEIAALEWSMVTDAEGNLADAIQLTNNASKGRSGRPIQVCRQLREALMELGPSSGPVITGRDGNAMTANTVAV